MTDKRTIVEVHILQTTAPGNLNRDDTGSPKTVVYGGTTRARVSSQAWKRPTRQMFRTLLDPHDLGIRTKRVVEVLVDRILERDPSLDRDAVIDAAEKIFVMVRESNLPRRVGRRIRTTLIVSASPRICSSSVIGSTTDLRTSPSRRWSPRTSRSS